MKLQALSLLVASAAAKCKVGITMTFYGDKDCTLPKSNPPPMVYDAGYIKQFMEQCKPADGQSFWYECSPNGILYLHYKDGNCMTEDWSQYSDFNHCYKASDNEYFKYTDGQ